MFFHHLTKISISILALSLFASGQAMARALTATYRLSTPCNFTYNFCREVNIDIPAGAVTITENVPMSFGAMGSDVSPAIIIQVGDETNPVLTLGIGHVSGFAYGPEPTSDGVYSNQGHTFVVNTSTSDMIKLEKTSSGVLLTSVDQSVSSKAYPVTCLFKQEQ